MVEQPSCPDDLALWAWLDGRAADHDHGDLDAHLDRCPRCLRAVAALGGRTGEAVAHGATSDCLDDGGRYRLLGAIATGGMGRVLLAHDRRLDREVAIKVVRDPERPQLISRLERELAITARLQHPAILPIHDAGTSTAGEPFFVMPRVVGDSLAAAVTARPRFADRLALVPAVARAVDAIAYAHEQGVLHRDLKPANVLLGPHGETLVIDWGLAIDRHAAAIGGAAASPERRLAVGSGASDAGDALAPVATATGAALGTLGYMSPEQLAGAALDARTDVYGLGGILYHTLAGAAPHAGADPAGARLPRPRPIRERCPEVPVELAAILARALAAEPDDRYASAGELADELQRYLTGQLVGAHRYSLGQRLRRFVARHRAAVIATAAALIAIGAIATVALRQVLASSRVAERERADAVRRGEAADALIAFTLGDLYQRLGAVGRLDLMRPVSDAVLRHYRDVPARDGAAGFIDRIRASDVLAISGDERRAAGEVAAAQELYGQSLARAEDAAAHASEAQRAQSEASLCRAHQRTADAWTDKGRLDEATAALQRALAHAERAEADAPANLTTSSLVSLADLARRAGDDDGARAFLERARPIALAAATRDPSPDNRRNVVVLLDQLGTLAYERGEATAAAGFFDENLARLQATPPADPDDAEYLEQLAILWAKVALARLGAGDLAAAKAAHEQSRDLALRLTRRDPSNVGWQSILDSALTGIGKRAQALGQLDEARTALEASLASSQQIAALSPGALEPRHSLAITRLSLAALLQEQRDFVGAIDQLTAARSVLEELVAGAATGDGATPDADAVRETLGAVLVQLAQVQAQHHDRAAALATTERSLELTAALLAASPSPLHRMQHAEALLCAHDLRADPALLSRARTALEPLRASASPDDARLTGLLGELFGAASAR